MLEKELDIDVKVVWNGATGEVDQEAFLDNLPEGITEEHFNMVDSFRGQFSAAVAESMLEYAEDHFQSNEDPLTIMDYSLGGNAMLSMSMDNDYHMVVAIENTIGDALAIVQKRAKEIYDQKIPVDTE